MNLFKSIGAWFRGIEKEHNGRNNAPFGSEQAEVAAIDYHDINLETGFPDDILHFYKWGQNLAREGLNEAEALDSANEWLAMGLSTPNNEQWFQFMKGFNRPYEELGVLVHESLTEKLKQVPKTSFDLVCIMNDAFGNHGTEGGVDIQRLKKQCLNLPDEIGEIFVALGGDPKEIKRAVASFKTSLKKPGKLGQMSLNDLRDGLCDLHVFAYGAHHLLSLDADEDMRIVLKAVMTRFIKDPADKEATIALHAAKGVTEVYFEGKYPKMIMKSAKDQPDAPKGKFLKSASCVLPNFDRSYPEPDTEVTSDAIAVMQLRSGKIPKGGEALFNILDEK